MFYVEPEQVKLAEVPVYHPGPRPLPRPRESQSGLKHSVTEVAEHSLQALAQEFKKICEPKISKLKGGYSANATATEHEVVQLVKDHTTEHAHGAVEFYLDMNDQWSYARLIEHLRMSFKSGETFNSLLGDFYARSQKQRETEDQFADELQVLARKVISVCPECKSQVNEALKTQFAYHLWDQYFAAMAHNLLKVAPPDTTFAKFWAECISIFGTRLKSTVNTILYTNVVRNYPDRTDQPVKSANQICR